MLTLLIWSNSGFHLPIYRFYFADNQYKPLPERNKANAVPMLTAETQVRREPLSDFANPELRIFFYYQG